MYSPAPASREAAGTQPRGATSRTHAKRCAMTKRPPLRSTNQSRFAPPKRFQSQASDEPEGITAKTC
jgi:hypothetical protein